ncbi:MAG: phosphoribosylanthranilate isomerase [Acidobacteria bacterium]|nr:phosphoribosylanthranilate isomerase [Acidobacteriota bacterium]
MRPPTEPIANIVQVAGIRSEPEAQMLVESGVDWLGFPHGLDVHAEDLPPDEAARIIRRVPRPARCILITYHALAIELIRLGARLGIAGIQLHGPIHVREVRRLKQFRPHWFLVKSLVIRPGNLADLCVDIRTFSPLVDAFITDTFDPATGASGATGQTHDWTISRRLVAESPRPVILAGGLTPANVAAAIRWVQPAGVDAHTGLEDAAGNKDAARVRAFVEKARRAFGQRE